MADKDDGNLVPIVFGLALAGGAALLLSKQGGGQNGHIVLSGVSSCSLAVPTSAEIALSWTNDTPDVDFHILANGVEFTTVVGVKAWLSSLIGQGGQGAQITYQVVGTTTNIASNTVTVLVANCATQSGNPQVSSVAANWS